VSLADITAQAGSSNPSDHYPIIKHLARHETLHGEWNEWAVGCICGGLYKTTVPDRWFIPSKQTCERIYKRHLIEAGVLPADEVQSDADGPELPDYEQVEQVVLELLSKLMATVSSALDGDVRTSFEIVKNVLDGLEANQ
jgi:hypothetical protein